DTAGSVNWASGDPSIVNAGTDAAIIFSNKVDLAGNISYGDAPGWYVDLTFSGLDPAREYTFVGTADRGGGAGYADRVTNWKIMGARAFTYASSTGAQKVSDDSVEFVTGSNTNGYVAMWTGVRPAADGTFVIRTSHTVGAANGGLPGAHAYKGYAGGAFLLRLQPSPNENWTAYNDSVYATPQNLTPNVTTFAIGRGNPFPTSGNLLKSGDGSDTGVTMTYSEFDTAGSVNWASGDQSTVGVGTDAAIIFSNKVDLAGDISYGDAPGWYVDLTFSGLDPAREYTFVGTVDRGGGAGYADRVTNWKILGASAFTYASSAGAQKVSESSVEFVTGSNTNGYVAMWTGIRPAVNGTFVIRTSHTVGAANGGIHGAHAYKGYAGGAFLLRMQPAPQTTWTAYNDSVYATPQILSSNVTTFAIGRGNPFPTSGNLLTFSDGSDTGVSATYSEFDTAGSVNWASGDPSIVNSGTDAAIIFSNKVDLAGNISYGDAPGWYVDLTFSGLDPAREYTFVGTVDRGGGAGYADRVTNWKILGASAFTYASSAGAQKVSESSVEFVTGSNTNGYVAMWTSIRPAANGTFVIRTSHTVGAANGGLPGAHAYKGYAGGAFLLRLQPEPSATWAAYNDSVYASPQLLVTNVTTIAIGRNNPWPTSANMMKFAGGADTGITATYSEFDTAGSVNWASGDSSTVNPGTDAATIFGGIVDLAGDISYGDAPGWYVDLTFTGLDPSRQYSFVGTVDRGGGAGYADRVTNWKIMGANAFTYASSSGAQKVSESSVEFVTGSNTNGYVARWNGIRPSTAGTFVIRTSHTVGAANGGIPGAHAYKGYAGGAFLLADQGKGGSGGGSSKPLQVLHITPSSHADVSPSTPLIFTIANGDFGLASNSVHLVVDGVAVTPTIALGTNQNVVSYSFPALLASASSHTTLLTFTDNSPTATPYSQAWDFTVLDYSTFPVYPASLAVPFDAKQYTLRGFAMTNAAPDPNDGIPLQTIDDAQAVWSMAFNNLVDPTNFNTLGYHIESDTINYQVDGVPKGNKAGDRKFPGIESSTAPGNNFALQAWTVVYLRARYYHMNVTMSTGFKLFIGLGADETELPFTFTPCTNCGGDDGPWYTDFLISQAGYYPFRLLFYSRGGGSSLEWVDVAPDGLTYLINENASEALPAYVPLGTFVPLPVLSVQRTGNGLNISWTGSGVLQTATNVSGPWSDILNAPNPYPVQTTGSRAFYRVVQ
ncbi:MAG: hypothetical protein NT154_27400, partial [Verrucomicrobia bacterium]|nr:hypothetical protein [Verrucomicrobiota bacterium]